MGCCVTAHDKTVDEKEKKLQDSNICNVGSDILVGRGDTKGVKKCSDVYNSYSVDIVKGHK